MLMRIDKLLSNMGIGSRKEVKEYIKKGLVKINGVTVEKPTLKVNESQDEITFEGEQIIYEKYIYLMMNKPKGVISATKGYNCKTVIDLLEENYQNKDIFPAGRLDKDTEGLVFLTNNGILAHNLLSPKKKVVKKYFATVENPLTNKDIEAFKNGIYIRELNYLTIPAKLEILSEKECFVYICEGKYHQVKSMFFETGNKVNYLKRISIGSLILDEKLNPGEYRRLSDDELEELMKFL